MIVSEGANTMDIGRAVLLNNSPRHRLDAGIVNVIYNFLSDNIIKTFMKSFSM